MTKHGRLRCSEWVPLLVLLLQVFQVQREALFNKSERQVAESQLATVQQQLAELQAKSSHIQELHKNIQESQGLVKEKDCKVSIQKAKNFHLSYLRGSETNVSVCLSILR